MEKVTWILDQSIVDRLNYSSKSMQDVITGQGHTLILVSQPTFHHYEIPEPVDGCAILYGSHGFVKFVNKDARFQPGALGVNDKTQATQYMSHLPLDWFLNQGGIFMTWGMFKVQAKGLFKTFETDSLFIRPNSGFKTFAGQLIKLDSLYHSIETLDQLSSVMSDTLILVSKPQDIKGEFRFVVADKKVVTGSEYRWDNKLDIRRDWPRECWDMAQQVANHTWQVDIAYTCDVALTQEGPKVVELNGFSCAGLYACDLEAVVQEVSRAAFREWSGLD